ncbi:hypothetical protein PR048_007973 [Dryococelus australis]|uniref:Uncharacterized protein n=1 Tax=Dryococelus australis TaxID=614101 RepID=A0ABQ9HVR9_9NEOP|nr:hypothetical protein PR048_007973 [Dryococelus australis]
MGIVPDDAPDWRFFSGISRFPRPCIPALLHSHLDYSHRSQDHVVMSRPNFSTLRYLSILHGRDSCHERNVFGNVEWWGGRFFAPNVLWYSNLVLNAAWHLGWATEQPFLGGEGRDIVLQHFVDYSRSDSQFLRDFPPSLFQQFLKSHSSRAIPEWANQIRVRRKRKEGVGGKRWVVVRRVRAKVDVGPQLPAKTGVRIAFPFHMRRHFQNTGADPARETKKEQEGVKGARRVPNHGDGAVSLSARARTRWITGPAPLLLSIQIPGDDKHTTPLLLRVRGRSTALARRGGAERTLRQDFQQPAASVRPASDQQTITVKGTDSEERGTIFVYPPGRSRHACYVCLRWQQSRGDVECRLARFSHGPSQIALPTHPFPPPPTTPHPFLDLSAARQIQNKAQWNFKSWARFLYPPPRDTKLPFLLKDTRESRCEKRACANKPFHTDPGSLHLKKGRWPLRDIWLGGLQLRQALLQGGGVGEDELLPGLPQGIVLVLLIVLLHVLGQPEPSVGALGFFVGRPVADVVVGRPDDGVVVGHPVVDIVVGRPELSFIPPVAVLGAGWEVGDVHHRRTFTCLLRRERQVVVMVVVAARVPEVRRRRLQHQGEPDSILSQVTPDFRMWESFRTMPLVGRFSREHSRFPTISFRCCSILTSITLIGSQDLAVKSRPNVFTRFISVYKTVKSSLQVIAPANFSGLYLYNTRRGEMGQRPCRMCPVAVRHSSGVR